MKIAVERRARKANVQAGMMDCAACFRLVCRDEDWFEGQLFNEAERMRRFRRGVECVVGGEVGGEEGGEERGEE